MFSDDGDDRVFGGEGNDGMSGGLGKDRLFGGGGDDWLDAENGSNVPEDRDIVDCGLGFDLVDADENDRVMDNCERIKKPL